MAKRRHRRKVHTVRIGETPTPERRKRNGGVVSEVVDRDVSGDIVMLRYKAVAECPLDVYYLEGRITEAEYKAAYNFRFAYFRGVLGFRVEQIGAGAHGEVGMESVNTIYSRELLDKAYRVLSTKQKSVTISVCGHDEWAGKTAKMNTLRRALERLAALWGFA